MAGPALSSTQFLLGGVVLILCSMSPSNGQRCRQDVNCFLPDCFCPTFFHPLGSNNIPQIVYFGFDDAVQSSVSNYYNQLFNKHRKNPNGCRITMTLYVSDKYTDYNKVNEFYREGDEMGVHSVTHKSFKTPEALYEEAKEQKFNLEDFGAIPAKDVVGWRSPNLQTAGDAQPAILKELNYTYDNSLSYYSNVNYPFPFTLDYGYPYPCAIPPCPDRRGSHSGFWEVMIRSFFDPETGRACGYVDGCRPADEDKAVNYLWKNFITNYENAKAPFGLNMHAAWFAFPEYLRAMDKFIDLILKYDDVYIVSVSQMLQWMKNPVQLDDIKYFMPFGCKGMNTTTSTTTSTTTTTTTTTTTPTTTTTTTTPTTTTTTPTTTTTTTTPSTTTTTTPETTSTTTPTTTTTTTTTTTPSTPTTPTTTTTTWEPQNTLDDKSKNKRTPISRNAQSFIQYIYRKFQNSGFVQKMEITEKDTKHSSPTRSISLP